MLASRLLSILMLLQTRGRMSANELAAKFEVGVRTIHRDIDQLSAAGVPVYAERGRNGGFQLRDGYRTLLTGLDQSEAETLFLAGLPGPAAELGLADVLASARLKCWPLCRPVSSPAPIALPRVSISMRKPGSTMPTSCRRCRSWRAPCGTSAC